MAGSQRVQSTVWLLTFLKMSFFCIQQKKETHSGLERLEGEEVMTEFSFLGELSLEQVIFLLIIAQILEI